MKNSRLVFLLLSILLLVPIVGGTLSRAATDETGSGDSLSKNLSIFSEVLSLIRRAYVDETSMEDLLAGALDGTTDALDPLSTYIPAESTEKYRSVRQIGRRHSGLTVAKERGFSFLVAVEAGSPGAAAGLQQGDIVAKVDELSTRRLPLWALQSLLAGDPGTELQLEVLRLGQTLDLELTLGTYEAAGPSLRIVEDQPVLRLAGFEPEHVEILRQILADLVSEDRNRLLIDLRGVAGGSPETAFTMAGMFTAGSLGELETRGEASLQFEGLAAPVWQGDTVLLIDNGSQGAAEVFATVLQQLTGAQLVGRGTFGHAGRQRLLPLSDGSQVLLTDAFYSGPDGEPIDQPLLPDVTVVDFNGVDAGAGDPAEDNVLQKGLELLTAEPEAREREVA